MARFQNGWVKSYRSLFNGDYDVYDIGILMWLIANANYVDGKSLARSGHGRTIIRRGQILTSVREVADALGIANGLVRKRFDNFVKEQILANETTNTGSLITICNYDKYQGVEDLEEQTVEQPENKRRANGEQTESNILKNIRIKEGKKLRIKDSTALAVATPSPPNELIAYYCEKFKQRYGRNPVIVGREAGAAKTILKSMSFEKAKQAVDGYFEISDPWLVQRMHPLSTLQEPSMINKAMAKEPLTVGNIEKLRKTNPFFEGIGETIIEVEGIKNVSK